MAQELDKIAANNGSKLITGTGANTGLNHTSFYVREDTVISTLTGLNESGVATNWLTEIGLSGITLKQGDFYPVGLNDKITAITLTSGSVILY